MEVDNDVESGLLEKFGCMQTLDQEDLVNQMIRLIGDKVNVSVARFYLEMNQWNVQAAVCSYFDLEQQSARLPSMTFIKDVTIGEGESVPPDTNFIKTWKVQNTGSDNWPPGCVLRYTQGYQFTQTDRVIVESLKPWQMADISIEMHSPREPGIYEAKWRMSTATGSFFGDTIWVIVTVEPAGTLALTQQMSNFHDLGSEQQRLGAQSLNPFASPTRQQADEDMLD